MNESKLYRYIFFMLNVNNKERCNEKTQFSLQGSDRKPSTAGDFIHGEKSFVLKSLNSSIPELNNLPNNAPL